MGALRHRNRVQSQLCFTGIDWAKTSAYSDSLFANIRINLKNREGNGIVGPGAEYWKLVDDIRNDLLNCRDAKTSERLISQVFHKNDLYRGPCLKKAPDLTIRWREDIDISGIQIEGKFPPAPGSQPAFQPSIPAEDASVISGDHRRFGVFLAVGPNIKKAQRVEGARIIDLAPTILYLLASPISEGMDGKMLSIIFHEPALIKNPFRIERHMLDDQAEENIPEYSENEKEAIADRLRQLGYLE